MHVFQLFSFASDEETPQPMESLERIGDFVKKASDHLNRTPDPNPNRGVGHGW